MLLPPTIFSLRHLHCICRIHGINVPARVIALDSDNARRYHETMIKSFASKETEKIFQREFSRKLPSDIQAGARRKLEVLDAADALSDLMVPPSNRLEKLSGERQNQYSIRINDQWRICFEWQSGDAYHVEIVDYH